MRQGPLLSVTSVRSSQREIDGRRELRLSTSVASASTSTQRTTVAKLATIWNPDKFMLRTGAVLVAQCWSHDGAAEGYTGKLSQVTLLRGTSLVATARQLW